MANLFLLDTDAVSSAANSVSKLAQTVANLQNSISSWDISGEDANKFDFAGARKVIANNVGVVGQTIEVTAAAMNQVVSTHTQIQSSLAFDAATGKEKEQKKEEPEETNEGNSSTGRSGGTSGGSSGGSSSSGRSGGTYSQPSRNGIDSRMVAPSVVAPAIVAPQVTNPSEDKEQAKTTQITTVSYAAIKPEKITDENKEMFADAQYDDNGYSVIDKRYMIACDSSYAKVGDVIRFTKDDKVIECVVGVNTVADQNKEKMFFLVDENNKNIKPVDFGDMLTDSNTKIENIGSYETVPTVSENTNTGIALSTTPGNNTQSVDVSQDNSNTVPTSSVGTPTTGNTSTTTSSDNLSDNEKTEETTETTQETSEESES